MTPLMRFNHLLEWLMEPRKTVYLPGHWFITKIITQEQPDKRDAQGMVWGKGHRVSTPSLRVPLPQHLHMPTNLEALQTSSVRIFYGGFIT